MESKKDKEFWQTWIVDAKFILVKLFTSLEAMTSSNFV